jgi:hypothetical protein
MNRRHHKILERSKRKLRKRLARTPGPDQPAPMLAPVNIVYDIAERTRAISFGGLGLVHTMVERLGLARAVDRRLSLLTAHLPYFESDHVLTLAYNVLTGGTCLDDIDRLRTNEVALDALGAERLPAPTTSGDFLRRFDDASVLDLQEAINEARVKVWSAQGRAFHQEAILDADGTVAETLGECKSGMEMSYKGIWGYAPLLLTLASTNEVLYVVNRSGNHRSSFEAPEWIDRALALVRPQFRRVWLRADSDFAMTEHFDRWDQQGVRFVFGHDAYQALVTRAEQIHEPAWQVRERASAPEPQRPTRRRPKNVKQEIIRRRGYKRLRLVAEHVAEFDYRPVACAKDYRVVAVRKLIREERGETVLGYQTRYHFYITNDRSKTTHELVRFALQRCNQENVIAQLKSGTQALAMPSSSLASNWAYAVAAALAWNLKAWLGLLVRDTAQRRDIVRMEFKRFLATYIQIPCQILRTGRQVVYRALAVSARLSTIVNALEAIKHRAFA